MRNFAQILNDLQKGGFNLDRNEYINSLTNSTLFILDDFGIERNTEYALEQIYNSKIYVHEKEVVNGEITQIIEIHYNFIGNTDNLQVSYNL